MQCVTVTAATMAPSLPSVSRLSYHAPTFTPRQAMPATTGPQANEMVHWIPPPTCLRCKGHTNPSRYQPALGKVCFLPAENRISQYSCAWAQPTRLNSRGPNGSGAFNHPCVPIAESKCGHLLGCAPVTSFAGQSLQEKYSRASQAKRDEIFRTYMAIRHPAMQTHNNIGILETINGSALPKQSYVHLDGFYWIESDNLAEFTGSLVLLEPPSLQALKQAFVAAERDRSQGKATSVWQRVTPPPSPPPQQPAFQALSWRARGPQQLLTPPRTPSPPLPPVSRKRAATPPHPTGGAKKPCPWRQ